MAVSTVATSLGTLVFVLVSSQAGVVLSSMAVSLAATLMCASSVSRKLMALLTLLLLSQMRSSMAIRQRCSRAEFGVFSGLVVLSAC